MDDDLNISEALAVVFDFINNIYKTKIGEKDAGKVIDLIKKFDSVLGVIDFESKEIPNEIIKLVDEREEARKNKEWDKADKIREKIKEKGFIIEDSKEGPR